MDRSNLPADLATAVDQMRRLGRESPEEAISTALATVRVQLGMSASFVSQFIGHQRIIRYLDADPGVRLGQAGDFSAREESYCQRIVDGRLNKVIPDTSKSAEAMRLPITRALPIGSHVGVPIRLANGETFGTMCCFASDPRPELDDSDAAILSMLSSFVADYLEIEIPRVQRRRNIIQCTTRALSEGTFHSVFQPIVSLDGLFVVGHEALTRFDADQRSPATWFREAHEVGLGEDLERAAIRSALARLGDLPAGTYLTLNLSPRALLSETTQELLTAHPLDGVVIEITEREPVDDYAALRDVLDGLKQAGALIAIDDVGAGFASLNNLLELRPDVIKLDMALTSFVSNDPARQALVTAMVTFARRIDAILVSESVSRVNDAEVLLKLGVPYAQGNLFGKPSRNFYLYTAAAKKT